MRLDELVVGLDGVGGLGRVPVALFVTAAAYHREERNTHETNARTS
jgi:hypothetical protein